MKQARRDRRAQVDPAFVRKNGKKPKQSFAAKVRK
jgi:hypothetical protein